VLVTVPAAALAGCSLRCRANGRTVPVAIKSVSRHSQMMQTKDERTINAELLQLTVHIDATGIDGVGLLDIVRNDYLSHDSQSSRHVEEQEQSTRQAGTAPRARESWGSQNPDDGDRGGDSSSFLAKHIAGVSVGLRAIPVLMSAEKDVYTALWDLGPDIEADDGEDDGEDFANGSGDHVSMMYAFGAVLRGRAPRRQAFQLACWAASKGSRGCALTRWGCNKLRTSTLTTT
jgi:hypothetical protein